MSGTVETRCARYWLDERGFLRGRLADGAAMTLEDARRDVAACAGLAAGRKRPVLIDVRGMRSQTRECRAYFQGEEAAAFTLACALLVASPVSRIIGSFFLGLNVTPFPMRLFTAEEEAIAWLATLA